MNSRQQDWFVLIPAILVAILLSAISVPEVILWGSPEWLALVVFYGVISMPDKVGYTLGFVLGLILDTLQGAPLLGAHSLGLCLIIWFGYLLGPRFLLMKMVQQVFVLFMLLSVYLMLLHFIKGAVLVVPSSMNFLVPAIVSSLLWPLVALLLNLFRHKAIQ